MRSARIIEPAGLGRGRLVGGPRSLRVSAHPSQRYLVSSDGAPFQIRGASPWMLVQMSREDVVTALDGLKAKRFNAAIMESAIAPGVTYGPAQAYGLTPFSDSVFTPNEAFWQHVDFILREAATRGIVILLAYLYLGFGGASNDGWMSYATTAGATACTNYGAFLGARYRNAQNLIWVAGGDHVPGDLTIPNALATGIQSQDTTHLITGHTARNGNARAAFGSYISLGASYTQYDNVASGVISDYQSSPTLPLFLLEGHYEGDGTAFSSPNLSATDVRCQAWQAYLQGIGGALFGNHTVWPFATGWQTALNSDGANHMAQLHAIMDAIPWHTLVPDASSALVTSGRGTLASTSYVAAALSSDASIGLIYLPAGAGNIDVDLSQMQGSGSVECTWIDPTTGAEYAATGSPLAQSSHTFNKGSERGNNAYGAADWLLRLRRP